MKGKSVPSPEYDLGYLQAGVKILKNYILSSDIYWTIGVRPPPGEPAYPQLTLGGLLLAMARLRSRQLPLPLQAAFTHLENEFEAIRLGWQVAWESKATHEFHARLFLWRDFLEEYRAHPRNNIDRYAYEVSRRVMLQLLSPDAVQVPQIEEKLLEGLDKILKSILMPGKFVWDELLAFGFPPQTYWYLYGQLKEVE